MPMFRGGDMDTTAGATTASHAAAATAATGWSSKPHGIHGRSEPGSVMRPPADLFFMKVTAFATAAATAAAATEKQGGQDGLVGGSGHIGEGGRGRGGGGGRRSIDAAGAGRASRAGMSMATTAGMAAQRWREGIMAACDGGQRGRGSSVITPGRGNRQERRPSTGWGEVIIRPSVRG